MERQYDNPQMIPEYHYLHLHHQYPHQHGEHSPAINIVIINNPKLCLSRRQNITPKHTSVPEVDTGSTNLANTDIVPKDLLKWIVRV